VTLCYKNSLFIGSLT